MGFFNTSNNDVDTDELIAKLQDKVDEQIRWMKQSAAHDEDDDVSIDPLQQCASLIKQPDNAEAIAEAFNNYNKDVKKFQQDLHGALEILQSQDQANVDDPRGEARERLDRCLSKLQSMS
jgi:hypothetical protein